MKTVTEILKEYGYIDETKYTNSLQQEEKNGKRITRIF